MLGSGTSKSKYMCWLRIPYLIPCLASTTRMNAKEMARRLGMISVVKLTRIISLSWLERQIKDRGYRRSLKIKVMSNFIEKKSDWKSGVRVQYLFEADDRSTRFSNPGSREG